MKPLSRIAEQVNESSTLAMDALYKQMKADGIDVLGFAAGEPDFPTPDRIKLAAIEAIINNDTKYTPATGTLVLKKAICQRLKADCGVEYQPSQIIVSSGAKHCIYLVMQSLVNEGDEVIIPTPYWTSSPEAVKLAGGVPVTVFAGADRNFERSTSSSPRSAWKRPSLTRPSASSSIIPPTPPAWSTRRKS